MILPTKNTHINNIVTVYFLTLLHLLAPRLKGGKAFMKRFICLIAIIFCIFLMALPAFAVNEQPADNNMVEGYMTWEFLGTMSGATAAVLLVVQFLKAPLDKIWKIPTRYIVYVFSFLLLLTVEIVNKSTITFDRIFLSLLNAIIVTIAAMGAYEVTFSGTDNLPATYR